MVKRVLITTFTFPPALDGVSIASVNLARGLVQRGFEVTVATSAHSRRRPNTLSGFAIHEFAISGMLGDDCDDPAEKNRFQRFIEGSAFDLIVCECWRVWSTLLAQESFPKISAFKILVSHGFTAHLWAFHNKFPFGIGQWLRSLPATFAAVETLRLYDHVVFLSKRRDLGRFFDHFLADLTGYSSYSIIPNGVWIEELNRQSIDFKRSRNIETEKMVLCVANYSDRKDQLRTLNLFARVNPHDTSLVFIGNEENDYTQQLASRLTDLRRRGLRAPVHILTGLSREETLSAYHSATILFLTAKAETQPIVLLEAMAVGLPFVSTQSGAIAELTGGLCAHTDRDLAAALERLLRDRQLRLRLSSSGIAEIQRNYLWPVVLDQYQSVIGGLSQRKRREGSHD